MQRDTIDHEIVVEHTISYVLEAEKIIKDSARAFDVAFLPAGHHLYAGILQAAGYLGLKNKNKIILIFEGEEDEKILVYDQPIGPFLGKIREFDKRWRKKLNATKYVKFIDTGVDGLLPHLAYLRMLFDTRYILPIFVGRDIAQKDILGLLDNFDLESEFNFVFVSDINFASQKDLSSYQKIGLSADLGIDFETENIIFKIFSDYTRERGLEAKILAHKDSSLLYSDNKNVVGYLSIVSR